VQKWRRINLGLAVLVLLLSVLALGKLGLGLWQTHAVQPEKKVVGAPDPYAQGTGEQLQIDDLTYQTTTDFLQRPTLVVRYRLQNHGTTAALPQYVFDSNVTFAQQTASGTTSVLATTTVPKRKLSFLDQNYQENGTILLKAGEHVTVVSVYRLESAKRPVTLAVRGAKRTQIKPWQLKEVPAHD
jgi:hypothetical protein